MKGVKIAVDVAKSAKEAVKEQKEDTKKRMGLVMRDLRRDVPAVVANAVSAKYNIKTSEMKPPYVKTSVDKTGKKKSTAKAAKVRIEGEEIGNMSLVYEGRPLTAGRFKMNPKRPVKAKGKKGNKKREKVQVTAEIQKGRRTVVQAPRKHSGGRVFVQNIKGVMQAVYTEDVKSRDIGGIVKTLSVPVMIDQDDVRKVIDKGINERVGRSVKRFFKDD